MYKREDFEKLEQHQLENYACKSKFAKRKYEVQEEPIYRTQYERDKDRIIHSKAFRRLEYKTQVYVFDVNDHVRTRLTHTLEVSHISKNIARTLGVNKDLAEAIALGHDLGHTPFGHAGEKILEKILKGKGFWGFRHNVQGVRVVDKLEQKYASHDGLNLTWEVREGILKHTKVPEEILHVNCPVVECKDLKLQKSLSTTVEGQIVNYADEIAQRCHDLDDCWELGLITFEDLRSLRIYGEIQDYNVNKKVPYDMNKELKKRDEEDRKKLFIRCLMSFLVNSLIENSEKYLLLLKDELEPKEINKKVILYSPKVKELIEEFKKSVENRFLKEPKVIRLDNSASKIVTHLYDTYEKFPEHLPNNTREKYEKAKLNQCNELIVIADYIAGMTDRYAYKQFKGTHLLESIF